MFREIGIFVISIILFFIETTSYTATAPTWLTSPYFRAGHENVIIKKTGNNTTPTYTFTFSSALSGTPNLAYGVKNYRGLDTLKNQNFEIQRVSLSSSTFTVSIQIFGVTNIFLLAVPYLAIDPGFPHHLNSFENVPLAYNTGSITNLTINSMSPTYHTQVIDYSQQSAANKYKNFSLPLSDNKIVLFLTSFGVITGGTYPLELDINYTIINQTHYKWTARVYQMANVSKLHFSQIVYNEADVVSSKTYMIVNQQWAIDVNGGYKTFPIELVDNMILALTDFKTTLGACGLEYNWDFVTNYNPTSSYGVLLNGSYPSPNSTANCGQSYTRSTLFYIKTWKCGVPYVYFNLTTDMCQDSCAAYYYGNYTAGTCTPCYYRCSNCTNPGDASACSSCETGLQRTLVNGTCLCGSGYYDDGYSPGCRACSTVDANCLTCTYTLNSSKTTSDYQTIFASVTWATDIFPNYTCTSCASQYFVNSTTRYCQKCTLNYCTNCTSLTVCNTCNSSVNATLYTDNLCYLCNVANCAVCSANNVCATCATGFSVTSGACAAICGDGLVKGTQQCDDGNVLDHDGCSSTCQNQPCNVSCQCDGWVLPWVNGSCSTLCGDGLVRGTEQCDDSNTADHDGCSAICLTQACNVSCKCDGWALPWVNGSCTPVCGDSLVRGTETCDDGNVLDHDGCSSVCQAEACNVSCLCDGWTLPWVNGSCTPICGDGLLRGTQTCDDSNTVDHDGCSSICQNEPCNVSCLCDGWTLPWVNGSCTPVCGDGLLRGTEQCDDGNLLAHDGCSAICESEPCNISCLCDGWSLPWVNGSCTPVCGDSLVRGTQTCDDGNVLDHDGCSSTCLVQVCNVSCLCDGWVLPWVNGSCTPICGDGLMRGTQQCDDGNLFDHDGCSAICESEPCNISCQCGGWTLPWVNGSCSTVCGDGFILKFEQCDDSNTQDGDGCSSLCIIEPPVPNYVILDSSMTIFPALTMFVMGFKIVGLQMLHVIQFAQLLFHSQQTQQIQISFDIHGYTNQQFFPLEITENRIFQNFNFMYLLIIALLVLSIFLQIYHHVCQAKNKVANSNVQNPQQQKTVKACERQSQSISSQDHSDDACDFTVHYKTSKKTPYYSKKTISHGVELDSSVISKQEQVETFWGSILWRQIVFNLVLNTLSILVYEVTNIIKNSDGKDLIVFSNLVVLTTMVLILVAFIAILSVSNANFGQNQLKFHNHKWMQFWIVMTVQKILLASLIGLNQFWSLYAVLGIKLIVVIYFACDSLFFESIQKARSLVTHLMHLILILMFVLNKQVFSTGQTLKSMPENFISLLYLGILGLVILIAIGFYIREFVFCLRADFRCSNEPQCLITSPNVVSAVFDVKSGQIEEDTQHPFQTYKGSNILDELKSRHVEKSGSILEELSSQMSRENYGGGAIPKRVVSINYINYLNHDSSVNDVPSIKSKKSYQTHKRSPMNTKKYNVFDSKDEQTEQPSSILTPKLSPIQMDSPKVPKQGKERVRFSEQIELHNNSNLQIQNPNKTKSKIMAKSLRRIGLKNKRSKENQQIVKQSQPEIIDQIQIVEPSEFKTRNVFNDTKKTTKPRIFVHKRTRHPNIEQESAPDQKKQKTDNVFDNDDALSINLE